MTDFAERDHQLYQSHFLNTDQLADRAPKQLVDVDSDQPLVEPVEKEVDNTWLNVRVGDGEWASAHKLTRVATDRTRQGRIADTTPPSEWSERPSYADPVADNMDPTSPESPESCF